MELVVRAALVLAGEGFGFLRADGAIRGRIPWDIWIRVCGAFAGVVRLGEGWFLDVVVLLVEGRGWGERGRLCVVFVVGGLENEALV